MSDHVSLEKYTQEIGKLNKRIGGLEKDLKTVTDKYNELKRAEVARSEIENYERMWLQNFVEDDKRCVGSTGIAKKREIRRQKWLHILMTFKDLNVVFLKQSILLDQLDVKYFSWFKGNSRKTVSKLSGYLKYKELNRLKIDHLRSNRGKDASIDALLNYICNQNDPANVAFSAWYKIRLEHFAICVSEIYPQISDIIHNATFRVGDEIPVEYTILKKPEYARCINYSISFYGSSSVVVTN